MSYIAFAWLTSFLYALGFLIGKFATKHKIANPWLYNFVWTLFIFVISISVALIQGTGWPGHWGSIMLAGFLSALSAVTYTLCLYALDVSVLGPLYIFRIPMSVVLGFLFFAETLTASQLLLIAVMTVAGMFVSMDERLSFRSFFQKPIAFALVTIAISAIYVASVKYAAQLNEYWTTVFWFNLFSQLFLLSTVPLFWKEVKKTKVSRYTHLGLSAIAAAAGGITVIPALRGNLGIVNAILTLPLGTVFVILLSFIAPNLLEKHPPKVYAVRLTAALVMFAGALGLSK